MALGLLGMLLQQMSGPRAYTPDPDPDPPDAPDPPDPVFGGMVDWGGGMYTGPDASNATSFDEGTGHSLFSLLLRGLR